MLFRSLAIATTLALASAEALPWADANPYAAAAGEAYADAYAEALAIAHPDPEAYALAASADDCATIACHAACGYLILNGAACSTNETDTYSGPYNTTCLCSDDSKFIQRYAPCMECGWTLWKYYGPYVTSAIEACGTLSTEPTGTLRCSTTLTESYTKDANAGCEYGGACVTSSSSGVSNSTVTGVSNSTSSGSGSSASLTSSNSTETTDSDSDSTSDADSSSGASSSASTGAAAIVGSSICALLLALLI